MHANIIINGLRASMSEPHTIWKLEMVPWSIWKTNTGKNRNSRCTCHPLLLVDNGSMVHNQTNITEAVAIITCQPKA